MGHNIMNDTAPAGAARSARPWLAYLLGGLLLLCGLGLLVPGIVLIGLGGSPYYAFAGSALLASGVLLLMRKAAAFWIYCMVLGGSTVWALGEAGWNGWALAPRLVLFCGLGLFFLLPAVRARSGPASRAATLFLVALIVLPLGLVAGGIYRDGAIETLSGGAGRAMALPGGDGDGEWREYGGDPGGMRFSSLRDLNPSNVRNLQVAWTYRIHGGQVRTDENLEVTPLKVGDSLYLCSPTNDVIALDPDTGKERWRFEARIKRNQVVHVACRGVAYHAVPGADPAGLCGRRVIAATLDARLIALDARTGRPCPGFGDGGTVDLKAGMGRVMDGYYAVTSAPQIVRGRIVLGGMIMDGQATMEPSGVIRAYDAVTGRFAWAWDVGRPGIAGFPGPGEEFTRGTPNSWAPMSADERLGLVYVPTGNATPDYYGGHRRAFDDSVSSAVVALDAESGATRWTFQTVRHDLWDYDVGSQPTLFDMPMGSRTVPALAQPTKRGDIFILDRRTGKPLTAVAERPAPISHVPGERTAPTQPFSTGFPAFAGPEPSEARMWGLTPFDQLWCRIRFRQARYEGPLTPPGLDRPTIVHPGYMGGIDWGGVAVDPARQLMFVNSAHMPMYNRLITRERADALGLEPVGTGNNRGGYIGGAVPQAGTPYGAIIAPFLSPLMVPCMQPPYHSIAVVDLRSRKIVWRGPLGNTRNSGPWGLRLALPLPMGTPGIGGALVTAGGLTFIGASQDGYLRALETRTGRELWRHDLPAGGQATPMSYRSSRTGRQYVVMAAGGHQGFGAPGDTIIGFALPDRLPDIP